MRMGVKLNGLDVVSTVLGQEGLELRHPPTRIREAIQTLKWGHPSESKDFLDLSKTTGTDIS